MTTLKVSQTFSSFQGEGRYTGQLAIWMRLFGCNLRCPGFSQPNPAEPHTYKPALWDNVPFNPKLIKKLEDFPVVDVGCDTLYAIDPRFKHLRRDLEATDVINEIMGYLQGQTWYHPKTNNEYHFCITGGEPLLQQKALTELFQTWRNSKFQMPNVVQFETNGTQSVTPELAQYLRGMFVHFNVSLKLNNVAGEDYEWSAFNIQNLADNSTGLDLKIVLNNSDAAWAELDTKYNALCRDLGWNPPVFIMPVGSTYEQQTEYKQIEQITKRAMREGYHISGRLHCVTLGNAVDV